MTETSEAKDQDRNARLKFGTADYWLTRLDRDGLDELAAKVRSKELSAHAAAIKAGFRRKPTVVNQLCRLWAKATEQERAAFLNAITADDA